MHFVFQFGEFAEDGGTDWPSLITTILTSFGSAFVGAWVALRVYEKTIRDQKTKEKQQRDAFEKDKLKYLGFLVVDVFVSLESLQKNVLHLRPQLKDNPIDPPTLIYYPPSSLLIIAKKINQEDYYHSSVNQLLNDEVAEMFYLINTIVEQYESVGNDYKARIVEIIAELKKLPSLLDQLKDLSSVLIRKSHPDNLEGYSYKAIANKLVEILVNYHAIQAKNQQNPNLNTYWALDQLVRPIMRLMAPYGNLEGFGEITLKSFEIENAYIGIINNISMAIAISESQAHEIINMTKRLEIVSQPLREFYLKNKINSSNVL